MLEIIIYGLIWCFAMYGILVMIQEVIRNNTYKKLENNINMIMTVKNVENEIESYIRDFQYDGRYNCSLTIIDLDSQDETMCILKELEKENENLRVFNKVEGENYLHMQVG